MAFEMVIQESDCASYDARLVLMRTLDPKRHTQPSQVTNFHMTMELDVTEDLQRFWELEELPKTRINTPEEQHCEDLFQAIHARDDIGRYTVRLPVKPSAFIDLGKSR